MSSIQINYDSVAEIYDLYVTADYDIPFFLEETANVQGPVLELTAGTAALASVGPSGSAADLCRWIPRNA